MTQGLAQVLLALLGLMFAFWAAYPPLRLGWRVLLAFISGLLIAPGFLHVFSIAWGIE